MSLSYSTVHTVCCAHLLRELRWVTENTAQTWAAQMATLLIKMKLAKEACITQGLTRLPGHFIKGFIGRYTEILVLGKTKAPRNERSRKRSKLQSARTLHRTPRRNHSFRLQFRRPPHEQSSVMRYSQRQGQGLRHLPLRKWH